MSLEIKAKAHDSETQQEKDRLKEKYLKNQFGIETISARADGFLTQSTSQDTNGLRFILTEW